MIDYRIVSFPFLLIAIAFLLELSAFFLTIVLGKRQRKNNIYLLIPAIALLCFLYSLLGSLLCSTMDYPYPVLFADYDPMPLHSGFIYFSIESDLMQTMFGTLFFLYILIGAFGGLILGIFLSVFMKEK